MILYHSAILLILVFFVAMLLWNLGSFRSVPVVSTTPPGEQTPFVSVLVPARNEAHRITPCAASLLRQNYPHYEVLILDDHSEDGTARVLEGLGYRHGEEGCFRILTGEPLPPGWTGKGWACHQLARAAKAAQGEYLLFLDADTEQTPEMLASATALARETGADLLSAWPYLRAESWSEKLVLPMIHLTLAFYPHALWERLQRTPSRIASLPRSVRRGFGAANGQFLFFRREAYEKIGGHAAQKGHLVEDVALGRAVASRAGEGMRLVNCDGTPVASVRMYTCFAEIWEGFTKNIRAAFEGSVGVYIGTGVMMTAVFFLPFVWIWLLEGVAFQLVAAQIALIYLIRTLLTVRFRTSWFGALFHPVGQLLCTVIALNSWRKSVGPGVTWKGRLYEVVHPE